MNTTIRLALIAAVLVGVGACSRPIGPTADAPEGAAHFATDTVQAQGNPRPATLVVKAENNNVYKVCDHGRVVYFVDDYNSAAIATATAFGGECPSN